MNKINFFFLFLFSNGTFFEPKGMAEEDVVKMINDIYVTAIDGLKKLHNG